MQASGAELPPIPPFIPRLTHDNNPTPLRGQGGGAKVNLMSPFDEEEQGQLLPISEQQHQMKSEETNELLELLMHNKEHLQFKTLTEKTDIVIWEASMALKCSKHTTYKQLTTCASNGQISFNPQMTVEQSEMLFILISDALGTVASKVIINPLNLHGIHLLAQVHSVYANIDPSIGNQQVLMVE